MEKETRVQAITDGLQKYLKLQGRTLRLSFYMRAAEAGSSLMRIFTAFVFCSIAFLFFAGGLAIWAGQQFGSFVLGFSLTGLLCLGIAAIFWASTGATFLQNKLVKAVSNGEIQSLDEVARQFERSEKELLLEKQALGAAVREVQEKLSALESSISHATGKKEKSGVTGAKVAGNVAGFVLENIVLPKTGILKRILIPLVAKGLITTSLSRSPAVKKILNRLSARGGR